LRTYKLYELLSQALVNAPFRKSLFRNGSKGLKAWNLTPEEQRYINSLPYENLEQMAGRIIVHWLVPITINDRYRILPEFAESQDSNGYIPIRLSESFVFGNGTHATSALCLSALDDHIWPGASVLDLGTGSGILSIAAARQGAGTILALDIDPASVQAAQKNVRLNMVEAQVTVKQGSLEEALPASSEMGGFDLVLANILTPVVLALLEAGLAKTLKPGAVLVTSGIEASEIPIVTNALLGAGLTSPFSNEKEGWAAVIARKPTETIP
jgi:ribosomal protein L11 methyltransferase